MKKRKLNLSEKPDLQAHFEDVNQITKPKAPEVSEIPDAEFRQLEDDRENSEKYEEEYEYSKPILSSSAMSVRIFSGLTTNNACRKCSGCTRACDSRSKRIPVSMCMRSRFTPMAIGQ